MDKPSFWKGKIFVWMLIAILVINPGSLTGQQINWGNSYGHSTLVAQEKNKLILADFWAIWCVPCLKTDKEVWGNDTISNLTKNFLCNRFNVSNGWQHAEPFYVDVIPTIMIMDYRGEVLYKKESYSDPAEMMAILSSFPEDVGDLYRGLKNIREDEKDHSYLLELALAYQDCALRSGSPAKDIFIDESNKIFRKAKTACRKQKDHSKLDSIKLLMPLNLIISGQPGKGTEEVHGQLDKIGEGSLSLAYFVLITGYLELEDKDMARKYYDKLRATPGGEKYLEFVGSGFQ